MNDVATIGIDLVKIVFQIHGVDAEGAVIVCRQLRRSRMLPFFKKLERFRIDMNHLTGTS